MLLNLSQSLLRGINHLGSRLPKTIQRKIADFPGLLDFFQRSTRNIQEVIRSPEGQEIVIHPLFHANLQSHGDLSGYEPDMRKVLQQLTQPGMTAYDIGANVGVFTFLLASRVGDDGHVYAFEPEPNNYECLRLSINLNTAGNIRLDTRAVSHIMNREHFDRRGGAFSGRLISENKVYQKTQNLIEVETVSIDRLVFDEGAKPPHIIKIDVEVNEKRVLEGMQKTLNDYSPIIVCELHTHLGESSAEVQSLLHAAGYTLFPIEQVVLNGIKHASPITHLAEIRHIVAIKLTKN